MLIAARLRKVLDLALITVFCATLAHAQSPVVSTAPFGTNTNQAASTAFVQAAATSPLLAANCLLGNPTGVTSNGVCVSLGATLQFSGGALQTKAMSGDLTTPVNSFVTTFATVNSNAGSFGSTTQCVSITVNGKGLITAASQSACNSAFTQNGSGAVASTVDAKLKLDYLHAKDFGAVGDNVTDDTTALQNWLTACQSNVQVCFLDVGTYKISSTLNITGAVHVIGAGRRVATLNPSAASVSAVTVSTASQVHLEEFGILYPSAANSGTWGVSLTGPGIGNYGSKIERLFFLDAYYDIKIIEAGYAVIADNLGTNSVTPTAGAAGVFFATVTNTTLGDHTVSRNTFAKAGATYGVLITGGSGIRITDNKIVGDNTAGGYGVNYNLAAGAPASGMSDILISNNSIENKAIGVGFARNNATSIFVNLNITGNQFLLVPTGASGGVVIPTDANGVWVKSAEINDNIVYGSASGTSYCFDLNSASKLVLKGNVCINAGGTLTGLNIGTALSGVASDNDFSSLTNAYLGGSTTFLIKDNQGVAFASLPATAQNGSQMFVTNGAPASSPCTGASTGSMAMRQNGAWKCF